LGKAAAFYSSAILDCVPPPASNAGASALVGDAGAVTS
jgi:hypothetical protein